MQVEQKTCSIKNKTEYGEQTKSMSLLLRCWLENPIERLRFQQELKAGYCMNGSDDIK